MALYNLFFKVGSRHEEDGGPKDGDLICWQPVEDYVGPNDRKGYLILQLEADQVDIDALSHDLPTAHELGYESPPDVVSDPIRTSAELAIITRRRNTWWWCDLATHFTPEELVQIRDHTIEVQPIIGCDWSWVLDIRDDLTILDRPFVHGSISSGSYTVGTGYDYSNLKLAIDDVASALTGTLTFTVKTNNTVTSGLMLIDQTPSGAQRLYTITSDTPKGGYGALKVSGSTSVDTYLSVSASCNIVINGIYWEDVRVSIGYPSGTQYTSSRLDFYDCVVDCKDAPVNYFAFFWYNNRTSNSYDNGNILIYNVLVLGGVSSSTAAPVVPYSFLNIAARTQADYDNTVKIYNLTILYSSSVSSGNALGFGPRDTNTCGLNHKVYNISVHNVNPAGGNYYDYGYTGSPSGTTEVVNGAYSDPTTNPVSKFTFTSCVETADIDFQTLDYADSHVGKIHHASVLYNAGNGTAQSAEDIINVAWPANKSIGCYSANIALPSISSVVVDPTSGNTNTEISFTVTASAGGGTSLEYALDPGDGTGYGAYQVSSTLLHTYATENTFSPTVKVRNDEYDTDTEATASVTITDPLPTAALTVLPAAGYTGTTSFVCDASTSVAGEGGSPLSFRFRNDVTGTWGAWSAASSDSFIYSQEGNYTPQVEVKNIFDKTDTADAGQIVVEASNIEAFKNLQLLFPTGLTWRRLNDPTSTFYKLMLALSWIPTVFKVFCDGVFNETNPALTTSLDEWEEQFGFTRWPLTIDADRRSRLEAAWSSQGGQTKAYLQQVLQDHGFPVYVHEWWSGDPPVTRDPNDYVPNIEMLVNREYTMRPRYRAACGDPDFMCGATKDAEYEIDAVCSYHDALLTSEREYDIPSDPAEFPYMLYIGGEIFPSLAQIPLDRADEFKYLCLKYRPSQQWVGLLVEYV